MDMLHETIAKTYMIAYLRGLGFSKDEAADMGKVFSSAVAYANDETVTQLALSHGLDWDMAQDHVNDGDEAATRAQLGNTLPHLIQASFELSEARETAVGDAEADALLDEMSRDLAPVASGCTCGDYTCDSCDRKERKPTLTLVK